MEHFHLRAQECDKDALSHGVDKGLGYEDTLSHEVHPQGGIDDEPEDELH